MLEARGGLQRNGAIGAATAGRTFRLADRRGIVGVIGMEPEVKRDGVGKKYFTTIEAAAFMGFAPYTLRKWRCAGRGEGPKYFKVHSRVRYAREDLEKFLTSSPRR